MDESGFMQRMNRRQYVKRHGDYPVDWKRTMNFAAPFQCHRLILGGIADDGFAIHVIGQRHRVKVAFARNMPELADRDEAGVCLSKALVTPDSSHFEVSFAIFRNDFHGAIPVQNDVTPNPHLTKSPAVDMPYQLVTANSVASRKGDCHRALQLATGAGPNT
jgi:hypothetical protein